MCWTQRVQTRQRSTRKIRGQLSVPALLPKSYKELSFKHNTSSRCYCFQRARRCLKNTKTFAHHAGYAPAAPAHPSSWLQKADLRGLQPPGHFARHLAFRWFWLWGGTNRTVKGGGYRGFMPTLSPLPIPTPDVTVSTLTLNSQCSQQVPGTQLPPLLFLAQRGLRSPLWLAPGCPASTQITL